MAEIYYQTLEMLTSVTHGETQVSSHELASLPVCESYLFHKK